MTYSGNKLFNGNNGVIAFIFLLFGAFNIYDPSSEKNISYFILIPFLLLAAIFEAFYFETIEDELIIKNYMLPFFKIIYKMADITEIQLLSTGYRSTAKACLKVVRGDEKSMGFKAAGLRIKDWQDLVDDLSSKNIKVGFDDSGLAEEIGLPE